MSTHTNKDKRTKEQILKLLDKALENEERLSEKIKTLENELKDCRKKVEDPRSELANEALSSSKVSFRIDYYRTDKKGPLKGIVEHLPSRQTKAFEDEGLEVIGNFLQRFLPKGAGSKKKNVAEPAEVKADDATRQPEAVVMQPVDNSDAATSPQTETTGSDANEIIVQKEPFEQILQTPSDALQENAEKPGLSPAPKIFREGVVAPPEIEQSPVSETSEGTHLLERLKEKIHLEEQRGEERAKQHPLPPLHAPKLQQMLSISTSQAVIQTPTAVEEVPEKRPSLLEKVRSEYLKSVH